MNRWTDPELQYLRQSVARRGSESRVLAAIARRLRRTYGSVARKGSSLRLWPCKKTLHPWTDKETAHLITWVNERGRDRRSIQEWLTETQSPRSIGSVRGQIKKLRAEGRIYRPDLTKPLPLPPPPTPKPAPTVSSLRSLDPSLLKHCLELYRDLDPGQRATADRMIEDPKAWANYIQAATDWNRRPTHYAAKTIAETFRGVRRPRKDRGSPDRYWRDRRGSSKRAS